MANKYSKYQLKPFASQYVDPKSDKVAELLRERYDKNKAQVDLIDRTMANMNVLGGDTHHVDAAKQGIRDEMQGVIKSGNYEDAGSIIGDQVSSLQTNEALLAAQKSYEARQNELEWQSEARSKGIQILDFGKDASKSHSSWIENPETGLMEANVYQNASEQMLDYNGAIKKYVGTIKGNVPRSRANAVALKIAAGYIRGSEGKQDVRRLVDIEYDQNIPLEKRHEMAKQDILSRVKIHTDQQIHASDVSKNLTAAQSAVQNSIMGGSLLSSNVRYTALDLDDVDGDLTATFDGSVLKLSSRMMDARRKGQTEVAEDYQKMLTTLGKKAFSQGTISEAEYKNYTEFEVDLWKNSGPEIDQKEFESFGTMVKYMTEDQWMPDFTMQSGVMGDFLDRTGNKFKAAAGVTAAAGVGSALFGGAAAAPAFFLSFGAATLATAGDLAVTLASQAADGFGNVRDMMRPETQSLGVVDSELTQLMQNVENLERINQTLGTTFTDSDIPALKDAATKYYNYKTEGGGDNIHEQLNSYKGDVLEGEVWTPSATPEGNKALGNLNTAFKAYSLSDFRVVGVPEDSDLYEKILEESKQGEHGLMFQGIVSPNLLEMEPTRIKFKTAGGRNVIADFKDAGGDGMRKLQHTIAQATGKLNFAVMDEVISHLKRMETEPTLPDLAAATLMSVQTLGSHSGLDPSQQHDTYREVLIQYMNDIPQVKHAMDKYKAGLQAQPNNSPEMIEEKMNQFIFEGVGESKPLVYHKFKIR